MGKHSSPVIGYRYYMGLHMGVCRGPVDELVEIDVGDKKAWQGSAPFNERITIDTPNLFGGDKGQGGVQGPLDVMMGAADQTAPSWLTKLHGALLPGFRGMFTLAFNGLLCSNNPNPQQWKVRARRIFSGWAGDAVWYSAKALIALDDGTGNAIRAMNPAHILYQLHTDPTFGKGLDASYLDLDAWSAAADQLYSEGFGLCFRWTRTQPVNDIIQLVVDHIGGVVGVDYETGLVRLDLIRGGYDVDALPHFDYDSGLMAIADDTSVARSPINEVIAQWVDPVTGDDRQSRVANIAAVQSMGGVVSQQTQYPAIPTEALAQRVALRDVTAATAGLRAFTLTLDRRGYTLRPGQPFRISAPDRGITSMVVRCGKKTDGPITDGYITITALQDVFALPSTTWIAPSPSEHVPPDQTPLAAPEQAVDEATYREVYRSLGTADLAALDADAGYLVTLGQRPSGLALGYTPATEAAGETSYTVRGYGSWTPTATLAAAVGPEATTLTFEAGLDLSLVALGSAARLDAEIVRVDEIDPDAGTLTVGRGCVDTVAAAHALGARIWFCDDDHGSDEREYAAAEVVDVKLVTHTPGGDLALGDAPVSTLSFASRQVRPYPPGNVTINGDAWPTYYPDGDFAIAWSHRDRVAQADQLIDQAVTDIGPEAGTTYTVRVSHDGTLEHEESGIAGNSYTYTPAAPYGTYSIELLAVRGGHESWQHQVRTFVYSASSLVLGEGGEALDTEDGDLIAGE